MRFTLASFLFLAACKIDAPHFVAPGDGAAPIDSMAIDSGLDADCTPVCNGNDLDSCANHTACALGCGSVSGATAHCLQIVPSNGASPGMLTPDVTAALSTSGSQTLVINSDTGEIDEGATVIRTFGNGVIGGFGFTNVSPAGFPPAGYLYVDHITLNNGDVLRVIGVHPLIILSRGDVVVHGTIDIAASLATNSHCSDGTTSHWYCPGPGGGAGGNESNTASGQGCAGGGKNSPPVGGGGGGMADSGGNSGTQGGLTSMGGGSCGDPTLVPLVGGSGGGAAAQPTTPWAAGGSGGGALQITSLTMISFAPQGAEVAGLIDASGSGGQATSGGAYGGGGGGAGGGILLEAPSIDVSSAGLYAGGGGGGTGQLPTSPGTSPPSNGSGENGHRGISPALGGDAPSGVGRGGNGAYFSGGTESAAGTGDTGVVGTTGTGGGGGATGYVRLNTAAGQLVASSATITGSYSSGSISAQ